jgi:heme oxygenase
MTPSPLTHILRTGTQDQHEAAEAHGFHRLVFGAKGPQRAREAFVRSLGQHLRVQETFEPRLIGLAGVTTGVGAILKPYHRHLHALRDDLEVLDATDEHRRALPATLRFISKIESYAAGDGLALLGVWYVFEGATNGGTIIGKRLREVLGLPDDRGTRFTNPHGPLVRPRWTEWKAGVDALQLGEARREAVLDAARETFRAVGEILGQVVESMPPLPAARPSSAV